LTSLISFGTLLDDGSQLHYPVLLAVVVKGKAWTEVPEDIPYRYLTYVFDAIINDIPAPTVEPDMPLQLLVTSLNFDSFLDETPEFGPIITVVIQRKNMRSFALGRHDGLILSGGKIDTFCVAAVNRRR